MVDNFRYETILLGGDVSLFANTRLATFLHTTIVSPRKAYVPLPYEPNPGIGKIEAETAYGKLSLDDFVTSPKSFIQAFIVAHKGRVVYERYPGMNPTDSHLWASTANQLQVC